MLEGKRIVITGVMTRDSIAFATAERAQQAGAEIVLTGFGRARRMTERAAGRLAPPARRRPRRAKGGASGGPAPPAARRARARRKSARRPRGRARHARRALGPR